MSALREATAVLVHRGLGSRLEVLLVERSPRLRFFGGYWACPGGVLDAAEIARGSEPADHRGAAVRELVEEIAAAPGVPASADLQRRLLGGRPDAVREVRERASPEELRVLGRMTTPPLAPVRYRTEFFSWEADLVPQLHGGELVGARWARPVEWLARWRSGEVPIVPPVLLLLELLERHGGIEEAATAFARCTKEFAAGSLHPVYFAPGTLVLPLETETIPPATTTNAFLIGGEHRYLVDPATQREDRRAALHEVLDRREVPYRLEAILLTHHHPDHVGAAEAVAARYHLPVLAHPATLRRLSLRAPARALHGGERLALGRAPDGRANWTLEVHATPGHAPGHLAFREDRYHSWIAGDLVSTLSTIVLDPDDGDLSLYRQSLRWLRAFPDGVIHPSHGPAQRSTHAVLDHFLAHRAAREDRLLARLARGPGGLAALVDDVYEDVPTPLRPLAARSLRTAVAALVRQGVVEHDAASDQVRLGDASQAPEAPDAPSAS